MNEKTISKIRVIAIISATRRLHHSHDGNHVFGRPAVKQTWLKTYRYNNCKLYNRHGRDYKTELIQKDSWNPVIHYQRKELVVRMNLHNLWQVREFYILKRMNEHNFPQYIDSTSWKTTVNRQRLKRNIIVRNEPEQQSINQTWDMVLERANIRLLYNNKRQLKKKDMWGACIRGNKNNVRHIHARFSWNYCMYENRGKLRRAELNETKEEI